MNSVEQSPAGLGWFKSSYSQDKTECIEIAHVQPEIGTLVRDTKDRQGGFLSVPGGAWSAFLAQVG